MHDETGRLVDDGEMLVLVGNAQLDLLVLELPRRRLGDLELDLLPALEPWLFAATARRR